MGFSIDSDFEGVVVIVVVVVVVIVVTAVCQ